MIRIETFNDAWDHRGSYFAKVGEVRLSERNEVVEYACLLVKGGWEGEKKPGYLYDESIRGKMPCDRAVVFTGRGDREMAIFEWAPSSTKKYTARLTPEGKVLRGADRDLIDAAIEAYKHAATLRK